MIARETHEDGMEFGRWLQGPSDEVVLYSVDGTFSRGLVRNRIRAIGELVEQVADLVAVVGIGDDRTLCASAAIQLVGGIATVLDPRTPGWVVDVVSTQPVARILLIGPMPSALTEFFGQLPVDMVVHLDAIIDAADRQYHAGVADDDPQGFAPRLGDCLVLFTSGSTGAPKGVLRTHQSILRDLLPLERFAWRYSDNVVLIAGPLGYVSTQLIVHQAFRAGVPLVIFDIQASGLKALVRLMRTTRTTLFNTQVATYRTLLDTEGFDEVPLRLQTVWGEPLTPADLKRHSEVQPECDLIIGYGSSETMVGGIIELPADQLRSDRLDHFRCPPGVDAMIIDPERAAHGEFESVPADDTLHDGELVVSNPWLATAYFRLPELTKRTFIDFQERTWCRTGDRAKWNGDGSFRLLGRIDDRLKILGNNVEPFVVEEFLRGLSNIRDAAVVPAVRPGGGQRLVAFVVPNSQVSVIELRSTVRDQLSPAYVPSIWNLVTSLPRLATGKVDRRTLIDEASRMAVDTHPEAVPTNELERLVMFHACAVLGLPELGIDDDLFALGLDSLAMVELQARLSQPGSVAPPLPAIAELPTVRALASHCAAPSLASSGPLVQFRTTADPTSPSTVSHNQRAIRFLLLPGAGASVLYLRHLAVLLEQHGGVRAVDTVEMESIQATVITITSALRERDTSDLIVIGHSAGGLVAMELARVASGVGLHVEGVVLLDTQAPDRVSPITRTVRRISVGKRVAKLRTKPLSPTGAIAVDLHRSAISAIGDQHFYTRVAEIDRFNWRPADVPAMVIKAADSPPVDLSRWKHYFRREISVETVTGSHTTMLTSPNVEQIVRLIVDAHPVNR